MTGRPVRGYAVWGGATWARRGHYTEGMERDGTGTPDRTQGTLARTARFLGMAPERRIYPGPPWAVANIVCALGMIGGGTLSAASGGPLLIVVMAPLGLMVCLQAVSDLLVGRYPRAVAALRALSVPAALLVASGWAWLAAGAFGLATLTLVVGLGIAAFAHAAKKADARRS